jgi:hypothetical protein
MGTSLMDAMRSKPSVRHARRTRDVHVRTADRPSPSSTARTVTEPRRSSSPPEPVRSTSACRPNAVPQPRRVSVRRVRRRTPAVRQSLRSSWWWRDSACEEALHLAKFASVVHPRSPRRCAAGVTVMADRALSMRRSGRFGTRRDRGSRRRTTEASPASRDVNDSAKLPVRSKRQALFVAIGQRPRQPF